MVALRKCSKCGVEKELCPEHFHRSKRAALGFGYACKLCKLAAKKLWVKANPDKVKEQKKRYYAKYPDKIVERKKLWRKKHPEKWKAQLYRQRAARKVRDPELYAAKRNAEKQRGRERLTNDYIRTLMVNANSLSRKDIPQELVDAKRLQLMITRKIKELEG
tara:strand:- start:273 stop:758 length:486 start_codon:yes stop_codon:yes gene_type:complete